MSAHVTDIMVVEAHAVFRQGLVSCLDGFDGIGRVEAVACIADAWAHPALGEAQAHAVAAGDRIALGRVHAPELVAHHAAVDERHMRAQVFRQIYEGGNHKRWAVPAGARRP